METAYGLMEFRNQDIDSFVACGIQTYELATISEIYRGAIENMEKNKKRKLAPDFQVMLHLHDGVSVLFNPRADRDAAIDRLKKDVNSKASGFGINATLTY